MKRPLRNLSPTKKRELERYVEIIEEGFAKAISTRRADRLKNGRILKIILYGSYARGDWVHDPISRYFSDFDLLVIVDHEDLTDMEFWEKINEELMEQWTLGAMRTSGSLACSKETTSRRFICSCHSSSPVCAMSFGWPGTIR